jgi:hypothetical protein
VLGVDHHAFVHLFDKSSHQRKTMPFAFGLARKPVPSSLMVMVAMSALPSARRTDTMIEPLSPPGMA